MNSMKIPKYQENHLHVAQAPWRLYRTVGGGVVRRRDAGGTIPVIIALLRYTSVVLWQT